MPATGTTIKAGPWDKPGDVKFLGKGVIKTKANGDIVFVRPSYKKMYGCTHYVNFYMDGSYSSTTWLRVSRPWVYYGNGCDVFINANEKYFDIDSGDVYLFTKSSRITLYTHATGGSVKLNGVCKYLRTEPIKKPTLTVTNLSMKKDNNNTLKFTASWKVPSELTNAKSNSRATRLEVLFGYYDQKNVYHKLTSAQHSTSTTSKTAIIDLNGIYPLKPNGPKVMKVVCSVKSANRAGENGTSVSYNMNTPRVPDAFSLAQNANTGVVSTTIKTNAGTDAQHRIYTTYSLSVYRSATNKTTSVVSSKDTSSTSFATSTDVSDRQNIPYGKYIRVTVSALSRGAAGDSAKRTANYYMSFPNLPSIKLQSTSASATSARTIINVTTNSKTEFPVTGVRLQKLVSVDYDKASLIPADASWQNVGPQDNGACTAMSIATEDLVPQAGKKTWVRLKTWNDVEGIFYRYSVPLRLTALETPAPVTPSAQDDNAVILSCTVGPDGTSAYVRVAWDPTTSTDDSNVTEVSWSDNQNAWKSTDQPDSFMMTDAVWNEGQVTSGGVTYRKSARIYITGLESGTKYYVAARRVLVPQDGETTYGPYSTKKTVTISDENIAPESVTLNADARVIRGNDIEMSWSYGSDMTQSSWEIRKLVGSTPSNSDVVLASGRDARLAYSQPYYRDKNRTVSIVGNSATSVSMYVTVVVGGATLTSQPVTVQLLDKPVFEVSAVTAVSQPASIVAFTNVPTAPVSIVIESTGVVDTTPTGTTVQNDRDAVWSGTVTPKWEVISSIASDTDVEAAKEALDAAQAAYDLLADAYEEACTTYETATAEAQRLTERIAEEERDLSDAEDELEAAQDEMESMQEDDPYYGEHEQEVAELTERVASLEDAIEDDEAALTQAQTDAQNAHDTMESIDYSTEEAALLSASQAYAAAVATAIGPSDPENVTHRTTITLPTGLAFVDKSAYKVRAFATNPTTGVNSEESMATFDVSWAHQAPAPSMDISVEPLEEGATNFQRVLGNAIRMKPPLRDISTDVYDLYRVTKDGTTLALRDIPTDECVTDKYAAFGDGCSYIVACRTADGDLNWLQYPYTLAESDVWHRSMVRIDWNGKSVELDRNVVPSDAYAKDFVTHRHLDGTISGHWNAGAGRTMGIDAAIVRGREAEQERLLRDLAKYDGPCLVRTTDGVWVEGNVQLDTLSFTSSSARGDITLTVTETTPTDTFAPTVGEPEVIPPAPEPNEGGEPSQETEPNEGNE